MPWWIRSPHGYSYPLSADYLLGMPETRESDVMTCRSCGKEERASEGYPCADCNTFLCVMCNLRGITRCRTCQAKRDAAAKLSR
jgi:hypothetical protein